MLKSSNKGLFVELSEHSLLAARTSRLTPPFVIEKVGECELQGSDHISSWLADFMGSSKGHYFSAICGVYPQDRVVRRASLENPAKAKDPAFLPEYIKQQYKIDVANYLLAVLHAAKGGEFHVEEGLARDLIV